MKKAIFDFLLLEYERQFKKEADTNIREKLKKEAALYTRDMKNILKMEIKEMKRNG